MSDDLLEMAVSAVNQKSHCMWTGIQAECGATEKATADRPTVIRVSGKQIICPCGLPIRFQAKRQG